jgi:hypothetical protein
MILKKLLQLSNLALGVNYNWYLEIPVHARSQQDSKQSIIRHQIRDRLKLICPKFYTLVKSTYLSQIRNAIGHSQYNIQGRHINYLNYSNDPKAYAPLSGLNFEQWGEYFHQILLMHNSILENEHKWKAHYFSETVNKGSLPIRITKNDNSEEAKNITLRNQEIRDWVYER